MGTVNGTGTAAPAVDGSSVVSGIPLDEEPGLGALTIPGYLRDVTTRYADREALVWHTERGVVRWTYATLWERSLEVARALVACGLGKDGRVGILMTNRPEFLAAAFGTALAGGVAVPLSTFSTPRELEYLLRASGVSILLFEAHVAGTDFAAVMRALEPRIEASGPGRLGSIRFPFLQRLAVLDRSDDTARGGAIERWPDFLRRGEGIPLARLEARADGVQPRDAAALFFSSGTTSLPKGVFHSQRAVAIQWWRWPGVWGVGDDVRCWTANGFFWSGNLSMVVGCALSAGGTIVLQSTFRAEEALSLMEAERVNMTFTWPHQAERLRDARNWDEVDLGSLRYVDAGLPHALHPTSRARWREPLAYGTTETLTIVAAFARWTREPPDGSYGPPLPGNTLKIVDPATGAVVARGERGEIAVKGPTLMMSYLDVPRDETLDAEGFFHTGDGGYVDASGRLFWEGRLSDVIKTGGANVSPREIDAVLVAHPAVKRAETVGVAHATLGEMVVSCIVPHDGARVEEGEIRTFARQRLARYKVPRRVLFFRDDELTTTGTDKVKAGTLRELAAERLADAPEPA